MISGRGFSLFLFDKLRGASPLWQFLGVGWKEVHGRVALVKKTGDRAFPARHPGGDDLWNGMIERASIVGDKFYCAINRNKFYSGCPDTPIRIYRDIIYFVVCADLAHV